MSTSDPLDEVGLGASDAVELMNALFNPMPPDLVATLRRIEAQVPYLRLRSAGGVSPFQATGTLNGLAFYFKYRYGHACISLGDDLFAPLYEAEEQLGDSLTGWLTNSEFEMICLRLIPQLARAPRLWEFEGIVTSGPTPRLHRRLIAWLRGIWQQRAGARQPRHQIRPGNAHTYGAWGLMPQAAWQELHRYPREIPLYTRMFSARQHRLEVEARHMDPQTITVDDRAWPDPEPRFVVLTPGD